MIVITRIEHAGTVYTALSKKELDILRDELRRTDKPTPRREAIRAGKSTYEFTIEQTDGQKTRCT